MSSTRKSTRSTRTPVVSEKVKMLAGMKRAASARVKQTASRALNADTLDSETASNEEAGSHDDENRASSQDGSGARSSVGNEGWWGATASVSRVNDVAADAEVTAGNARGDGSVKRRKKAKKQRKERVESEREEENDQGKNSSAGGPDDTDAIFEGNGGEKESADDSSVDDIFASSVDDIFLSVSHGPGREAPTGKFTRGCRVTAGKLFPILCRRVLYFDPFWEPRKRFIFFGARNHCYFLLCRRCILKMKCVNKAKQNKFYL